MTYSDQPRFQIVSRHPEKLPLRLTCRTFSFIEAHHLCCEWNKRHEAEDMVWEAPVKEEK